MPKRKTPIPVYFTSLEIENVRCFGNIQRLDLTNRYGQPARWTLILGENGVGKTTLLQCLAWMRLVPVDKNAPLEARLSTQDDDFSEPPPLAKGELGPALLDEENKFFERLLRAGSDVNISLKATISTGGLLSPVEESLENASDTSKRGIDTATGIQASFDNKGRLLKLDHQGPLIENELLGEFHEPLVVAYGANRQRGIQNLAAGDLDDPISSSRLSELTELYDIEEMLSGLDYAYRKKDRTSREYTQLERLREILAKILPGDEFKPTDIEIFPPDVLDSGEPSGVCLKSFSGLVPLSELSLGYQTTLAWTADLAWRLLKRYPGSLNPLAEPAVVLIDEIDLHLHPLWQLRIMDDLSEIFPSTQFVATSHSPLMVQVGEAANFVLLQKREAHVEIVNDPIVVRSWRVDQILSSELFNVPRGRDKETERLFARRAELIDKPSRNDAEEEELERLRIQISKLPTAQDPDDQKAMDFIREAAALFRKDRIVKP